MYVKINCLLLMSALLGGGIPGLSLAGAWEALNQIGYDPVTGIVDREVAAVRIQNGIAFFEAQLTGLEPSVNLTRFLDDSFASMSALDLAELYSELPHEPDQDAWRGVGVRGAWSPGRYGLRLDDPNLASWRTNYREGRVGLWGSRPNVGDLGARLFMKPGFRKQVHVVFQSHLHTGRFPAGNVVRAACAFLVALGDHLAGLGAQPSQPADLDERLAQWLADGFPNLTASWSWYVSCEQILESVAPDGTAHVRLRLVMDDKALKKHYPTLARMARRGKKMAEIRFRVVDSHDTTYLEVSRSGGNAALEIQFRTRDGIILPLSPDAAAEGIDLLDPTALDLVGVSDVHIRSWGVHLRVTGLRSRLTYRFADAGPSLETRVTEEPEAIAASGFVLGIIPIWLIDVIIPSNLKAMTAEFVRNLVKGRDGEGLFLRAGYMDEEALRENLWSLADADVASNGLMRFGFSLIRKLTGGERRVGPELRAWAAEHLDSFSKDAALHRDPPGG